MTKATAEARANIAIVKYWGRRGPADLNIPPNDSIGITFDALRTTTTVEADPALAQDSFTLNGEPQSGKPLARVARHLDALRKRAGASTRCRVASVNDFAAATGLASSASAFAALTVAGFAALGARVDPREASTWARLGSGSAARSVFGGFVRWRTAATHEGSFAEEIAPASHLDVHDVALTFSQEAKKVGSLEGHATAESSPLHATRLAEVNRLLPTLASAIAERDFATIGEIAEADALLMHAVMMTSAPSLVYWLPETVAAIRAARRWREERGIDVYFTIDAGPNVHFLCRGKDARAVAELAQDELRPESLLVSPPGEGARVVGRHLL